jgi:hypothetical protein
MHKFTRPLPYMELTNMKISVVTTFHKDGYEKYGRNMINTFLKNWPAEVTLYVYAEDCVVTETAPNLIVKDLHQCSPELVTFKEKWRGVPKANGDVSSDPIRSRRKDSGKGFKWNAIRFSHKVYAIFACAKECDSDILMWMDADTICHSPITMKQLTALCPVSKDLCFLGRRGKFSECGLYSMSLKTKMTQTFLERFQHFYDDAENGIFKLEEWHDSFVFDAVRRTMQLNEWNWSDGLVTGEGHPLINSQWGAWLDHLKGGRKDLGKSKRTDLLVKRTEPYWLNLA